MRARQGGKQPEAVDDLGDSGRAVGATDSLGRTVLCPFPFMQVLRNSEAGAGLLLRQPDGRSAGPPYPPAISISGQIWSLAPHSSAEFMARIVRGLYSKLAKEKEGNE